MRNIVILMDHDENLDILESVIEIAVKNINKKPDIHIDIVRCEYDYASEVIAIIKKNYNPNMLVRVGLLNNNDSDITIFINPDDTESANYAKNVSDNLPNTAMVPIDTIFTNNEIDHSICILCDKEKYINGHFSDLSLALAITDPFNQKPAANMMNVEQQKKVIYTVFSRGKAVLNNTNFDVAVAECNKICNAIIVDSSNAIVHRSTFSKVNPTSPSPYINKPAVKQPKRYINPKIPTHTIKKTNDQNRF